MSNETGYLGGLQSLRAIAAFGVVLQHTIYYVCVARGIDFMPYLAIGFGGLGVNLFFVISGFVMAACTRQGNRFLWNRALRIYPGYWLAVALAGGLFVLANQPWHPNWISLALVPGPLNFTYHIPYWTLVYEMGFYVLIALLLALGVGPRGQTRFCLVWVLAIVVVSRYQSIPVADPLGWLLLAPHNIFFAMGLLLGLHYRHLAGVPSVLLAWLALALITLGELLYAQSRAVAFLVAAPGMAAVVVLGIRHLRVRWLERLGDASYGIYLLHAPLMVVLAQWVQARFPDAPLAWALLGVGSAASVGAIAFGVFERRLYTGLRALQGAGRASGRV